MTWKMICQDFIFKVFGFDIFSVSWYIASEYWQEPKFSLFGWFP